MPCERCGMGNVAGVCKECQLLERMDDAVENGTFVEGGDD